MTNIDTQIIYDKNGKPIPQYLDVSDKTGGSAGTMKPISKDSYPDDFPDSKVKQELESIKAQQQQILDRLDSPINTQLTGPNTDKIISSQKEIINVLQSDKLIFGVYWDKSSNPTMTRTDAAVGLEANVGVDGELVRNDFDNLPIWGEMQDVEDVYGNYFVRIPKFYIQKNIGKNHKMIRVSKTRYPGFYLPYVFWDFENGKELDYYDHGKYNASLGDGSKLESKPGKHPLINSSIVNFRNYAQNNNDNNVGLSGYQQLDIHAIDVIQALFTIEFATLNSQSIMQGFTTGRYTASDTTTVAEADTNRVIVSNSTANHYEIGQSIGIGSTSHGSSNISGSSRIIIDISSYNSGNTAIYFDGEPVDIDVGYIIANRGWISGFSIDVAASSGGITNLSNGKYPCVYRGIENPWGSIYQWVDGININNHKSWIAKNAESYASNVFASPYEELNYINAESNGYATEMGFDYRYPFAQLTTTTSGGGASTYYADNYYQDAGQRVARFGGSWSAGSTAGLWCWALLPSAGSTYVASGGRLLKKAS